MKTLFRIVSALLATALLSITACNSQPTVSPIITETLPPAAPTILVTASLTPDASSRWQQITLTFTDESGHPLPGLNVGINQVDLDFLFSIEYGCIEPEDFAEKYETRYWEIGINTWRYGLYFMWSMIEPFQDDFRFWLDYPAMFCGEVYLGEQDTCTDEQWEKPAIPEERMERMFATTDMGLYPVNHQQMIDSGEIPAWTNPGDPDGQFRDDYEDYLRRIVTHYAGTMDVYRLGLESNSGLWTGGMENKDYDWMIEWITWQCAIIKEIDPHALISIDLLDVRNSSPLQDPQTDDWSMLGKPNPMWEDHYVQALLDAGAEFDMIGIEYHPGWNASFEMIEEHIAYLEQFGMPIYIWEFFVPSGNEPSALFYCDHVPVCPPDGFTEEYQADTAREFFTMMIERHPLVIGIEYLGFVDDPLNDLGPMAPASTGLLHFDGTPKPAYGAIQDYWFSLFTDTNGTTNADGQIQFTAIPGWFEITVDERTILIQIVESSPGDPVTIP